ncbi:MAG: TnpV protein, partial [Synergistaceae bacterium]|nr:TnpV protein [Synergistaceae bacterium]
MDESKIPPTASLINFMTGEELNQYEDKILTELETKPEEDMTIYQESELTESDKDDLPEGTLMREPNDRAIFVKILDVWMPYQMQKLKQPPQPLTKYGRMRRKFLEEWRVRTALELGENLLIHCAEIQEQAKTMKQELMSQLEQNDPPPDKSKNPMAWVQHMNSLDMQA